MCKEKIVERDNKYLSKTFEKEKNYILDAVCDNKYMEAFYISFECYKNMKKSAFDKIEFRRIIGTMDIINRKLLNF